MLSIDGIGCSVQCSGFTVQGSGFRVQVAGSRVYQLSELDVFKLQLQFIKPLAHRRLKVVLGLGFLRARCRVQGAGCRVQGASSNCNASSRSRITT